MKHDPVMDEMRSNPFIHIQSAKFHILPGEEEALINEGVFGKSLAEYLKLQLSQGGYDIPFICAEDWGWWVQLKGQPFTLGLCIYGLPKDDGSLDLCVRVSAVPERRWSWTRFKFIDQTPWVTKLHDDLKHIFEGDKEISTLGYFADFPLG